MKLPVSLVAVTSGMVRARTSTDWQQVPMQGRTWKWHQEHAAGVAEITAEPAEYVAAARGWVTGGHRLIAVVQQCQVASRSWHGWWRGAEPSSSTDQQHPSAGEKEGWRQAASGSEQRRGVWEASETGRIFHLLTVLKRTLSRQKHHSQRDVLMCRGGIH